MVSNKQSHVIVKTATAATVAVIFMVLYGLTNTAAVLALTLATPPMVIFSPVLIMATIIMFLLGAGFVGSVGFGAAAGFVFYWVYGYLAGKHSMDHVQKKWDHE